MGINLAYNHAKKKITLVFRLRKIYTEQNKPAASE